MGGCSSGGNAALGFGPRGWVVGKRSQSHTTLRDAAACEQGRADLAYASVGADNARKPVPMPTDCNPIPGAGGYDGSPCFYAFSFLC